MKYGSLEFLYAEPFVNALVDDLVFRSWVLRKTKFFESASCARVLNEEMFQQRNAKTWWRSHWAKCSCEGCQERETDILVIFESALSKRFALHFEVKQPRDGFKGKNKIDQARAYRPRAECWVKSAPKNILPHSDAATVLLCSELRLKDYTAQLPFFDSVITFGEIADAFPHATYRTA